MQVTVRNKGFAPYHMLETLRHARNLSYARKRKRLMDSQNRTLSPSIKIWGEKTVQATMKHLTISTPYKSVV